MGHQQQHIVLQLGEAFGTLLQELFPVLVVTLQFLPDLAVEFLGGGVEKLELEQVAQPVDLAPEHLQGGAALGLAALEQGEFDDGLVHEEVNDGIAVVGSHRVLFQVYAIHHLRPLVVAGDDAFIDHDAQQAFRLFGVAPVEITGDTQLAGLGPFQQDPQVFHYLGLGKRTG